MSKVINPVRLEIARKMRSKKYRVSFEYFWARSQFAMWAWKARKRLGITQQQLALRTEMAQPTISRLTGAGNDYGLSLFSMIRIADALGSRLEIRAVPRKRKEGKHGK